jgi:4-hydroxy-tetrahydrodipicolinate synthase
VVASEVAWLQPGERERIVRRVAETAAGRVPLIVGASAADPRECAAHARLVPEVGAAAFLVAVPDSLYDRPQQVLAFFRDVVSETGDLPLLIQDLEYQGPGLDLETLCALESALPSLVGFKIETLPAGPKYSAVREALGAECYVAGGWAVPQTLEALDRGVDALMPESSMVPVYCAVDRAHRGGDRQQARRLFWRLLPVLAYSNQEIATSVAFFKRLLVRKGLFRTARMRMPFRWDRYAERVADELIDHYLALESELAAPG